MKPRAWPRTLVGVLSTVFALAAARPALACYCIEYCSSTEVGVAPPPPEGDPQPNVYIVAIRWSPYASAPSDCTYQVSGYPIGLDTYTPMSSCTPVTDASLAVVGLDCVVEADASPGEDWAFYITSASQVSPDAGNDCTTPPIFLPGPLSAPPVEEGTALRSAVGQVTLRWSAPQGRDGTEPVLGYALFRSSGSQPAAARIADLDATETSYQDSGLKAGESYAYEIYAVDRYGMGSAAVVKVPAGGGGATGCNTAAGAASLWLVLAALGALRPRRRPRP